jgi:hypothetical protein
MAMDALEPGVDHRQCLQANNLFGQADCCKNKTPIPCLNGGLPPLDKFAFASLPSNGALTMDEVVDELCVQTRPFLAVQPIAGGGSHMTVVVDYDTTRDWMIINDPWTNGKADQYAVPYTAYHDAHGPISSDIYKIEKKAP